MIMLMVVIVIVIMLGEAYVEHWNALVRLINIIIIAIVIAIAITITITIKTKITHTTALLRDMDHSPVPYNQIRCILLYGVKKAIHASESYPRILLMVNEVCKARNKATYHPLIALTTTSQNWKYLF